MKTFLNSQLRDGLGRMPTGQICGLRKIAVFFLLFSASPVLLAKEAVAPAKDYIWIEAESPAAGNFPALAANPYRAVEFWETDLLSGGEWIGMKWADPKAEKPFLEYQFEADEAGDYDFYARKFYTFGNFRWRVNDGAWHEADALEHTPLDMVSFRETGDRIALNWFFMGNSDLKAGTNTLRVEPVYSETTVDDKKLNPLGYDAFLFTRDLFFPNGKMKPGERASAQSSASFAPDPPIDGFEPCAIDWRLSLIHI